MDECPVCLTEFSLSTNPNKRTSTRFACTHTFCTKCDAKLQITGQRCPLCRASRKRYVKIDKRLIPLSDEQRLQWKYFFLTQCIDRRVQAIKILLQYDGETVSLVKPTCQSEMPRLTIDTFAMNRYEFEETLCVLMNGTNVQIHDIREDIPPGNVKVCVK